MMDKGKHTKPLIDKRRLGEFLAMIGIEWALILILFAIWWFR